MFCPRGYITLSEIRSLLLPAQDILSAVKEEPKRFVGISVPDTIENRAFSAILNQSCVHLSSPAGQIVKFASEEIFDKIDLPKELEELLNPIIEAQFGITRPIISFEISRELYGVEERELTPRPAIPLFMVRPYYVVSLSNYRRLQKLAENIWQPEEVPEALGLVGESDPFWHIIERFEGWSICAPEEDFADLLMEGAPEKPKYESEADLVQKIISGFDQELFRTKKEAFETLSGSASHRKFNMAWARAAERRPELSSPGRKGQSKN